MGEVLKTGLIYSMDTAFCGYGTCIVIVINTSPPSLYQVSVLIASLELTLKRQKKKKQQQQQQRQLLTED